MAVSGRELSSLDFGNLIGGPLNAVVEAQAKSAITTANFIKEVGFDKDGKVINVDFKYNRKDDDGRDRDFTLTVPFLTMLPIPYISIDEATVEFNAKITSTTENNLTSNFSAAASVSVGGSYWFVRASVKGKTSYQRSKSSKDKEERTFDMHVMVKAHNADMPAGTERILTILENSIDEKGGDINSVSGTVSSYDAQSPNDVVLSNIKGIKSGWNLLINNKPAGDISAVAPDGKVTLSGPPAVTPADGDAFEAKPAP